MGDESADYFYVIEEGEYDVFALINNELTKVHEYVNNGSFGYNYKPSEFYLTINFHFFLLEQISLN